MKSGELRHKVVIKYAHETQDTTSGAMVVTWLDLASVWAAIEPLSVKDFIAANAEQSDVTTRITVRYRDDITSKMRIYHPSKMKTYDIRGVLSDKKSGVEYLTLPCKEA